MNVASRRENIVAKPGEPKMTPPDKGLFSYPAMSACLSEGRQPGQGELEQVAARIWLDTYRTTTGAEWGEVEAGSVWERRTLAAAAAALRGTHSIRPEIPQAA
jgi:hypothetical protein